MEGKAECPCLAFMCVCLGTCTSSHTTYATWRLTAPQLQFQETQGPALTSVSAQSTHMPAGKTLIDIKINLCKRQNKKSKLKAKISIKSFPPQYQAVLRPQLTGQTENSSKGTS